MKAKGLCAFVLCYLTFSAAATARSVAYVTNAGSNDISAYSIDPGSGALAPIAGSPFGAGPAPNSATLDPTGRFLYVTNGSHSDTLPSTVSAYAIDPATGTPTPIAGSPFAAGVSPHSARVHPSGRYLYVPNAGDHTISAYAIDSRTGALTPLAGSPFPFSAPGAPDSMTIDPSGRFAYVTFDATFGSGFLGYAIDANTGGLTQVAVAESGSDTDFVLIDPSGRFVYAASRITEAIWAFSIDPADGILTPIAGSPFTTGGATPAALAIDPRGRFLYAADDTAPNAPPLPASMPGVAAFRIDPATGALTTIPGSPFAAGGAPSGVAVDGSGRFLYVANQGSDDVSAFAIDGATGGLSALASSPFAAGTGPEALAITPAPAAVPAIPALAPWGLALLSCLLAASGAVQMAKRR